jgi:hypothetical protein
MSKSNYWSRACRALCRRYRARVVDSENRAQSRYSPDTTRLQHTMGKEGGALERLQLLP